MIAAARYAWAQERIVRISGFISPACCGAWCTAMAGAVSRREITRTACFTPKNPALGDPGGPSDHYVMDGHLVASVVPQMIGAYEAARLIVAEVTGLDVIVSPYPRSAVNIKRYDAPSGVMSAHYDSNPISVMVHLTTNTEDGCTVFHRPGFQSRREFARAGDLLIFDGRNILHEGAMVTRGVKVVALWNFYTEQDQSRPAGMDDLMYGPEPAAAPARFAAAGPRRVTFF